MCAGGAAGSGAARAVDAGDGLCETKTPRTRGTRSKEAKQRKGVKFSKIMQATSHSTKVSRESKRAAEKNEAPEKD